MVIQRSLIDSNICSKREVSWNSVRAIFTEIETNNYEVLLDVSSNKFLVNMITDWNWVQYFEILAVKWFLEISKKVMDLVKRLVIHLWDMID